MKMKAAGSCSGCPTNVQPLYCFRLQSGILRQRKNDVTGVAVYCFEQPSLNSCRRAKEDRDNLRDDTWSPSTDSSSVPPTSSVYNTKIVCIPDSKHHHWVDVCTVHSYLACLLCWPTWMVGGALWSVSVLTVNALLTLLQWSPAMELQRELPVCRSVQWVLGRAKFVLWCYESYVYITSIVKQWLCWLCALMLSEKLQIDEKWAYVRWRWKWMTSDDELFNELELINTRLAPNQIPGEKLFSFLSVSLSHSRRWNVRGAIGHVACWQRTYPASYTLHLLGS